VPRPPPERVAASAKPPDDPRHPHILRYLRDAIDITHKKRKTPITHQDIENRITAELAKDPHHCLQGRVILLNVCKSLDLPFYANRMRPDLFRPPHAPPISPP
jgi:hypothetical protein